MRPTDFSPQHRDLAEQLIRVGADVAALLSNLTRDQLARRPDPTRWSIGEAIEHLTVTNIEYLGALEAALPRTTLRMSDKPYSFGFIGRQFIKILEPPVKRRFKAPKRFLPPIGELGNVAQDFAASQAKILQLLKRYDDRDLASVSVPSPAAKLLRFKAAAAFAILAAHSRRHLWQAEQVRQALS